MKAFASSPSVPALRLNPLIGLACAGLAVAAALLFCAPDAMVKDLGIDLLLTLDVEAPVVWFLVLDSPDFWHVMVFAALALGLLIAIPARLRLGVNIALFLGVFLEAAQVFVPSRTASLADLLYNLAGVGVGVFFYFVLSPLFRRI